MKACHTNLYTPGVGKWSHGGGGGAGRGLDRGTHDAGAGTQCLMQRRKWSRLEPLIYMEGDPPRPTLLPNMVGK